jgi:hypothetical protein
MRTYARLFTRIGAFCLLFNTEDACVLFATVAGILVIALSAPAATGTRDRQDDPPPAAWASDAPGIGQSRR